MYIAIQQYEDGEIGTVKAFQYKHDANQFLKTRWEEINDEPFDLKTLEQDGRVSTEYGAVYSVYEVEIS
jgi:hypothetical protein